MTLGYDTSWILLWHLAKIFHNQIFLPLKHIPIWLICHRFLALSGLRCLMTHHRFSSTFSQVWLSCIIKSYNWHILSYASWILKGISCHIAYLWVKNTMLSSSMSIINCTLFLSFLVLEPLSPWILMLKSWKSKFLSLWVPTSLHLHFFLSH